MGDYVVYMHTFPNGKKYIGITCQDVKRRWRNGNGYYGQTVYNAISKYGWENIKHEILYKDLSKEEAERKEIELIKNFDTTSHKNGYNVESGGYAPNQLNEETKRKLSKAHKGKKKGAKHWNYGKHWSDEVKEKISKSHKGKKISEETKKKLSKYNSGKGNPMYGKKMTKEKHDKLQEACVKAKSKPIICVETNTIYKSSAEAERTTGICSRTINYVCKHYKHYKTAGGYHWEYYKGGEC